VGPWIEYTPWEPCEFMSIPRELNCQEGEIEQQCTAPKGW